MKPLCSDCLEFKCECGEFTTEYWIEFYAQPNREWRRYKSNAFTDRTDSNSQLMVAMEFWKPFATYADAKLALDFRMDRERSGRSAVSHRIIAISGMASKTVDSRSHS